MAGNFATMGESLDKAIDAIGPNASRKVLTALETLLEAASEGGLREPYRGVIEDFITNQY